MFQHLLQGGAHNYLNDKVRSIQHCSYVLLGSPAGVTSHRAEAGLVGWVWSQPQCPLCVSTYVVMCNYVHTLQLCNYYNYVIMCICYNYVIIIFHTLQLRNYVHTLQLCNYVHTLQLCNYVHTLQLCNYVHTLQLCNYFHTLQLCKLCAYVTINDVQLCNYVHTNIFNSKSNDPLPSINYHDIGSLHPPRKSKHATQETQ